MKINCYSFQMIVIGGGRRLWRGFYRLITSGIYDRSCRHRFLITPVARERFICSGSPSTATPIIVPKLNHERIDEILSSLKSRSSNPSITDNELISLPDLCLSSGRYGQFAKVCRYWSQITKPILDGLDYFNVAKILWQLGTINQRTNGDLVNRLNSWTPITYMMDRMIKMGFDRFRVQDLIRALDGIHELATCGIGNRSLPIHQQGPFRSVLDSWVAELEKCLLKKSISDIDYPVLIRRASIILYLLSRLNRPPSTAFLPRLCQWSKTNFDRQIGFGSGNDRVDIRDILQSRYFAETMLKLSIDPDQFAPGSWNTWFDLIAVQMDNQMGNPDVIVDQKKADQFRNSFNRYSKQSHGKSTDRLSFAFARNVISVTADFGHNPATARNFWRIFPIWATFTQRILLQIGTQPRLNDRTYLPNFICNLGKLSQRLLRIRDDRRFDLRFVVPLLEDAMIKIGAGCDYNGQSRSLIGFRDLKLGLDLENFQLSQSYFGMLGEWCVEIRLGNKNLKKSTDMAALLLFLLRDMRSTQSPPKSILAELCHLFEWGLDELSDQDLFRALPYLADACLHFQYNPAKSTTSPNRSIDSDIDQNNHDENRGDFWSKYFDKVGRHLGFDWSFNLDHQQKTIAGNYLLGMLPRLPLQFGCIDHFRRVKRTYEERVKEMLPHLDPKGAQSLERSLRQLQVSYGIEMDMEVMDGLKRLKDCRKLET